jgi:hypothetical protein
MKIFEQKGNHYISLVSVTEKWKEKLTHLLQVQNGIGFLSGHDSIFSKYLTGTTPSKPSVKITLFSEM